MDSEFKLLATIELGTLSSRIVQDTLGRRCLLIPIGEREVLFTITHALMVREILDVGLRSMAQIELAPQPQPAKEEV